MKKFLLTASLFALIAGPSFAEAAKIEIKVPYNPSQSEVKEAHKAVIDAAENLCADAAAPAIGMSALERRQVENRCVKLTYKAAVERARLQNLAAFDEAIDFSEARSLN